MAPFLKKNLVLIFIALCCCKHKDAKIPTPKIENDTAAVLKLLFDSAFSRNNLPDISALKTNSYFGDSIIFCTDSFEMNYHFYKLFPPDIDGKRFKFLSHLQICSYATEFVFVHSTIFPNYLEISNFEKNDTGYVVYLRNTCVIPDYKKKR